MKLHLEQEINAPADAVWNIIGRQFAEIAHWSSIVETSRRVKATEIPYDIMPAEGAPVLGRVTKSKLVEATEILTAYSDDDRAFTFTATDLPKFMLSKTQNNTKVFYLEQHKSRITVDIEMDFTLLFSFLGPVMKRRMANSFSQLLGELKEYAETNHVAVKA